MTLLLGIKMKCRTVYPLLLCCVQFQSFLTAGSSSVSNQLADASVESTAFFRKYSGHCLGGQQLIGNLSSAAAGGSYRRAQDCVVKCVATSTCTVVMSVVVSQTAAVAADMFACHMLLGASSVSVTRQRRTNCTVYGMTY